MHSKQGGMDVHWCLYDIQRVDVLWRVGIGVRGGGGEGKGEMEGRRGELSTYGILLPT
jgi:hypothetical protein